MQTLAADVVNTDNSNLVIAIVALGFTLVTTIGGVGFWIVSQIVNVRTTMEGKHLTYDTILETVVGKQAILESKHNALDNRQTVTETILSAIPQCAARDDVGGGGGGYRKNYDHPRRAAQ